MKPGRSLPLVKDNNSEFSQDVKRSTSQSANDVARNVSERRQMHQQFGETHSSISVGRQSEWKSSMSQAQKVNKSFSAHTVHTSQVKFSMDACGNSIDDDDDDDILEVIHVNRAIRFLAST